MTSPGQPGPLLPEPPVLDLIIVTGMSSAGRSTTANVLEDLGWYVVDNLPPQLLGAMVELASRQAVDPQRPRDLVGLAAVVDVRSRAFFEDLQAALRKLRASGLSPRVVFLDASDEVLIRRQEAVRRPHPLQGGDRIVSGISRERERLEFIREQAEVVIDTSGLNVTQLKMKVAQAFGGQERTQLRVTVMSFGFKYGLPLDANFVADMRFLPNPFWIPELRPHTGEDPVVRDFVLSQVGATEFLDQFLRALAPVFTGYPKESKRYLTIAIGCTGGKHRSVAMSQALGERLTALDIPVGVLHRDLGRE